MRNVMGRLRANLPRVRLTTRALRRKRCLDEVQGDSTISCSNLDNDCLWMFVFLRYRLTVGNERLDIETDGILCHSDGLLNCLTLCNTSRESGYSDRVSSLFRIRVEDNGVFVLFHCCVGRTPLTGGRLFVHLARTPARAFGSQRIRQRPRARTAASFGRDPRRWRDPIAHQFNETPDMIGQATGHRRSAGHPGALPRLLIGSGATQLMMGPTDRK